MKSKTEGTKNKTKTTKTKKTAAKEKTKNVVKKAATASEKKKTTKATVKKKTASATAKKTATVKKVSARKTTGKVSAAKAKTAKTAKKSKVLLDIVLSSLDKNKAENIVVIDLEGKSSLADYMVVASGRSQKQVGALADIVAKEVKTKLGKISVIEGRGKSDWAVMDFGDVIVHIFHPEARDFYKLEEIWQD